MTCRRERYQAFKLVLEVCPDLKEVRSGRLVARATNGTCFGAQAACAKSADFGHAGLSPPWSRSKLHHSQESRLDSVVQSYSGSFRTDMQTKRSVTCYLAGGFVVDGTSESAFIQQSHFVRR